MGHGFESQRPRIGRVVLDTSFNLSEPQSQTISLDEIAAEIMRLNEMREKGLNCEESLGLCCALPTPHGERDGVGVGGSEGRRPNQCILPASTARRDCALQTK